MKMKKKLEVEIHFTITLEPKDAEQIIKHAEEMGYGYGDPGKKELIRRLVMSEGMDALEQAIPGLFVSYSRKVTR